MGGQSEPGRYIDNGASRYGHEPERLVVFGAGVDDVNGVYRYFGRYSASYPCYKKPLTETTYYQIIPTSVDCSAWMIGRVDIVDKELTSTSYYVSNRMRHDWGTSKLPPSRGWWPDSVDHRLLPPVILPEHKNVLDWRQGPEESLADYKIEIVLNDVTATTATYFVHKLILSSGSDYFCSLFVRNDSEGPSFAEVQVQTIRLQLAPSIAAVMPQFLDYLYAQHGNGLQSVDFQPYLTQHIAVMYWLADYFQVPALCQELLVAFKTQLTRDTCFALAQTASQLQIPLLYETALSVCSQIIVDLNDQDLETKTEHATEEFLLDLLHKCRQSEPGSRQASKMVAQFCVSKPIDADMFVRMVESSVLPKIHSSAVWVLLDKEKEFMAVHPSVLSDLQERCVEALARDFVKLEDLESGPLQLQSPVFVFQLLITSQQRAKSVLVKAASRVNRLRNPRPFQS